MMRVLVVEPFVSGHRMVYVKYLLQSLARHGMLKMILATSELARRHPQVTEMVAEFGGAIELVAFEMPTRGPHAFRFARGAVARQFAFLHALKKVVGSLIPDYVFIPFVDDYLLVPLALRDHPFGKIPWGGIAIRPRHHLRRMDVKVPSRWQDVIEQAVYRALWRKQSLDRIFCIDPYFRRAYPAAPLTYVPDPSDLQSVRPAKTDFGIDPTAVVLLVYGNIDSRKAIDRLLNALHDPGVPDMTLLLVGRQDEEMRSLLAGDAAETLRRSGRLIEADRIVEDEEEAAAFERADIVWNYYPNSYCASGVLVRAGQLARPVLATREGLVGSMVLNLKMGLLAAEDDQYQMVTALAELARSKNLRRQLGQAGFEHFSRSTAVAFADPIIEQIAGALSLAPTS